MHWTECRLAQPENHYPARKENMKNLILMFALLVGASMTASAQTTDVSCYEVPVLSKTMCTLADGSGVMTDHPSGNYSEHHYTADAWTRMKAAVSAEEKRIVDEREAEAKARKIADDAEWRAMSIKDEKSCKTAGFVWIAWDKHYGECHSPGSNSVAAHLKTEAACAQGGFVWKPLYPGADDGWCEVRSTDTPEAKVCVANGYKWDELLGCSGAR
jgi:hypothetical protein